ncbi:MAG: 16S rRNA (cytidine(1402)-2'-O)-methyltransferase [Acidobacteriaceae bacterium]|nr:16S rRNA (cytidine(1402)-2'-O)-methyltransferase [Acidobacteriaceae bacterium]
MPALYLVATPIGNLEDITFRAIRILREEVDLIACEDTRQTSKLLQHYGIHKPLLSYHEHNEVARAKEIVTALQDDQSVALVSDAGMPLISDPGYRVVTAAIAQNFKVVPVPGPSAALSALAASGLATDRFRFIGFVPQKPAARRRVFEEIANESATVIAYESPHRVIEALADIAEILGERTMVLARELTKIHEEFLRGTAQSIREELERRGSVKGEITLVIARAENNITAVEDPSFQVERLEREGVGRMEAIKRIAKQMGLPKREVYRLVSEQGSSREDKAPDLVRRSDPESHG